jgi:hypothetical protein
VVIDDTCYAPPRATISLVGGSASPPRTAAPPAPSQALAGDSDGPGQLPSMASAVGLGDCFVWSVEATGLPVTTGMNLGLLGLFAVGRGKNILIFLYQSSFIYLSIFLQTMEQIWGFDLKHQYKIITLSVSKCMLFEFYSKSTFFLISTKFVEKYIL